MQWKIIGLVMNILFLFDSNTYIARFPECDSTVFIDGSDGRIRAFVDDIFRLAESHICRKVVNVVFGRYFLT